MWWYRDQKKNGSGARAPGDAGSVASRPAATLDEALAEALAGRPAVPDGALSMSLLVDHQIRLADGTVRAPLSWQEAELCVARALGPDRPARLYNLFAREFGDGYSRRDDLPADHARILSEVRAALLDSSAVSALESVD